MDGSAPSRWKTRRYVTSRTLQRHEEPPGIQVATSSLLRPTIQDCCGVAGVMVPWAEAQAATFEVAIDQTDESQVGCGSVPCTEGKPGLPVPERDDRPSVVSPGDLAEGTGGASAPSSSNAGPNGFSPAAIFESPCVTNLRRVSANYLLSSCSQLPEPPRFEMLDPPKSA